MTLKTVTVSLPKRLYRQVRQRAQSMNHSVEDELATVVKDALREDTSWVGISTDISSEVQHLQFLDDDHLWRVAKTIVPTEKSERMQVLSQKQRAEGLTQTELEETEQLQHYAHRVMLLRAEAAVLLKKRGFDISPLRQMSAHS